MVDNTITVAIVAGVFSLIVGTIGSGGLLDRFYSPAVEIALDKVEEEPAIQESDAKKEVVSSIQGALTATQNNDSETAISQIDLALNTLDTVQATAQEEDKELWKVIATVTNYGYKPATNLTLSFKAPLDNSFISITNEFSTPDLTVRNFINRSQTVLLQVDQTIPISQVTTRPTFVQVHTPEFSPGTGSKIVLDLKVNNEPNLNPSETLFDATAVYKEGSAHWVTANVFSYKAFVDTLTKPNVLLIFSWVAFIAFAELVLLYGEKHTWFVKDYKRDTNGKFKRDDKGNKIPESRRYPQTDTPFRIIRGIFYFGVALIIWFYPFVA